MAVKNLLRYWKTGPSSIQYEKTNNARTSRVPERDDAVRHFWYWTEIVDAGILITLRQLRYGSRSTAAPLRRPLTGSLLVSDLRLRRRASARLSHCNPFRWPILQLGCSYLFPAARAPSCGPCRHHAAPAAIMRPQPPSCGPCRHHAAPAAITRPLLLSCGPCRHHAAPAAIMRSFREVKPLQPLYLAYSSARVQLPLPSGPCRHHEPLPLSCTAFATLNHCNPFSWPIIQRGCSYLFPVAPAAIIWPLSPSCRPCCHPAAPATIMRPLPPSHSSCHCHAELP
jgi:hypothetical protein